MRADKSSRSASKLMLMRWHGPGLVLGHEGATGVYVAYRGRVQKLTPECVRKATALQQVSASEWADLLGTAMDDLQQGEVHHKVPRGFADAVFPHDDSEIEPEDEGAGQAPRPAKPQERGVALALGGAEEAPSRPPATPTSTGPAPVAPPYPLEGIPDGRRAHERSLSEQSRQVWIKELARHQMSEPLAHHLAHGR